MSWSKLSKQMLFVLKNLYRRIDVDLKLLPVAKPSDPNSIKHALRKMGFVSRLLLLAEGGGMLRHVSRHHRKNHVKTIIFLDSCADDEYS